MIVSLTGKFAAISPSMVVLDVHGVGYAVNIPLSTFSEIEGHAEGRLLIYHRFLQNGEQSLYGFFSKEESQMFGHLLGVSGVGGSTALLMLSGMSVEDLQHAIATEKVAVLEKIKGIGKKTAGLIVHELKDKFPKTERGPNIEMFVADTELRDAAVDGLQALGFKKTEALKVVEFVLSKTPDACLSDLIRSSLQQMSK